MSKILKLLSKSRILSKDFLERGYYYITKVILVWIFGAKIQTEERDDILIKKGILGLFWRGKYKLTKEKPSTSFHLGSLHGASEVKYKWFKQLWIMKKPLKYLKVLLDFLAQKFKLTNKMIIVYKKGFLGWFFGTEIPIRNKFLII